MVAARSIHRIKRVMSDKELAGNVYKLGGKAFGGITFVVIVGSFFEYGFLYWKSLATEPTELEQKLIELAQAKVWLSELAAENRKLEELVASLKTDIPFYQQQAAATAEMSDKLSAGPSVAHHIIKTVIDEGMRAALDHATGSPGLEAGDDEILNLPPAPTTPLPKLGPLTENRLEAVPTLQSNKSDVAIPLSRGA